MSTRVVNLEQTMEKYLTFDNMLLFTKPEQSGKTFLMLRFMADMMKYYDKTGFEIINIIFTDNSLLQAKQMTKRVGDFLIDIEGRTYCEFSSKSNTRTKESVCGAIIMHQLREIICCTNSTRIEDIISLIDSLRKPPNRFKFNVFLDEADKFIRYVEMFREKYNDDREYTETDINFICLTATPDPLFKKYRHINVLGIENTTSEHYRGYDECIIKIVDCTSSSNRAIVFVQEVLKREDIRRDIIPGKIFYIPADPKIVSHEDVCSLLVEDYNFAVFVVNGNGIRLSFPGQNILDSKNDELSIQISKMCEQYKIRERFPIAITGNICISRGISIMMKPSEEYPLGLFINNAIIYDVEMEIEISQMVGRMKGNVKNWSNYQVTNIYTTPRVDKCAKFWEAKSRELAKKAWEQGGDNCTVQLNRDDFIGTDVVPGGNRLSAKENKRRAEYERDLQLYNFPGKNGGLPYIEFPTFESMEQERIRLKQSAGQGYKRVKMPTDKDENGFVISNTSKHKVVKRSELNSMWKEGQSICANLPMSSEQFMKKEEKLMLRSYCFYEDNETNPNNVKFAMRYVQKIN